MTDNNGSMFELTLEQQFEYRRMVTESQNLSHEQAIEMLLQATRLLMLKDNTIRHLMKEALSVGNASILR